MNLLQETKYIMDKYDVHPNKRLGQNFLFDENALNQIAENVTKEDTIIEIGPGLGTLTAILAEKAKKVIAIELDPKMYNIIKERFIAYNNIEIINEDVLKVDISKVNLKQLISQEKTTSNINNVKVVANLPYYITTSIITNLLKTDIQDITILIQKEVAQRICAMPGDKEAGAITYFVNYYADAHIIGNVSKESFIPNPEVESSIVNIQKLDKPRVQVKDEKLFFEIIKTNFTKRRKTILNSLSTIANKNELEQILTKLGISLNERGENLSLEQYAEIANALSR